MFTGLSRFGYLTCAWLFVAGILTQVFLAGLSLLGGQPSWPAHVGLGHGLGVIALLMVLLAYTGRLPRATKLLTWLSFGVYILLADILVFLRDSVPLLAALHPVMAVVLFAIAVTLARRAWRFAREPEAATTPAIDRDVADVAAEVAGGRRGL